MKPKSYLVPLLLCLVIAQTACSDRKWAEDTSGLNIPSSAQFESESEYGSGPQAIGERRMVIVLSAEEFEKVAAEAPGKGYTSLAAKNDTGFVFLDQHVGPEGWYFREIRPNGGSTTVVLDAKTHRILMSRSNG